MFWQWVGDGVRLLWWHWDGFVVNKVLYGVSESEAIIGKVAYILVVGAVGIRVVASGYFLGKWSWVEGFEVIAFNQFFQHRGERCEELGENTGLGSRLVVLGNYLVY